MKSLPRSAIVLIILAVIGLVVMSVGQFASKSTVFARGSLVLKDGLQTQAKGIRTVFIVIYDEESPAPMPYAAIREVLSEDASGEFLNFILTKDNMQIMNQQSHKTPSKLRIKARLDRSGTAGLDQPGDIVGELSGVSAGAEGLKIVLDRHLES